MQRFMVCSYRTAYFRDRLMLYLYGYKTINGGASMIREDIRGICHRPCIYNDNDKCDMWDQLSVPDETEWCANQIDV